VTKCQVNTDTLFLEGGAELVFPQRIAEVVELEETLVVRLNTEEACQVFGVRYGRIAWQVQKAERGSGTYILLRIDEEKLFAWDANSLKVQIDPADGAVVNVINTM
jgi:hypothetical protein